MGVKLALISPMTDLLNLRYEDNQYLYSLQVISSFGKCDPS